MSSCTWCRNLQEFLQQVEQLTHLGICKKAEERGISVCKVGFFNLCTKKRASGLRISPILILQVFDLSLASLGCVV